MSNRKDPGLQKPDIYIYIYSYVYRFKGFLQIYQLQTENDEEETWRDLVS